MTKCSRGSGRSRINLLFRLNIHHQFSWLIGSAYYFGTIHHHGNADDNNPWNYLINVHACYIPYVMSFIITSNSILNFINQLNTTWIPLNTYRKLTRIAFPHLLVCSCIGMCHGCAVSTICILLSFSSKLFMFAFLILSLPRTQVKQTICSSYLFIQSILQIYKFKFSLPCVFPFLMMISPKIA